MTSSNEHGQLTSDVASASGYQNKKDARTYTPTAQNGVDAGDATAGVTQDRRLREYLGRVVVRARMHAAREHYTMVIEPSETARRREFAAFNRANRKP